MRKIQWLGLILVAFIAISGMVAVTAQSPVVVRRASEGMEDYKPLKIFDPPRGSEITPIQRAAQERLEKLKRQRRSLAEARNLITFDLEAEGDSEQDAIGKAMVRALKAASARIYFEDHFIVGLDLLEAYLAKSGAPAVARTTILEQRILPQNRVWVRALVSVNMDELVPDLQEKRFIGTPNIRPLVAVHLAENIEGSPGLEAGGRERIESTMEASLFRVFSRDMKNPPLNVDLDTQEGLLRQARMEAQRHNIDVIITGSLEISSVKEDKIYFNDFNFQQAEIVLNMYRVDNGELLASVEDSYSAPGNNKGEAINAVLDSLVVRASEKLAANLRDVWPYLMLNSSDKRLMLTGVVRDDIENVRALLKTFSPEIEVYEKSFYGDVSVLNIVIPKRLPEPLEVLLEQAREPQMNVRRVDEYRIELELL